MLMKKIIVLLLSLWILPELSQAQSVTIGAIHASSFCGGDSISVSFTASGSFGHKNAFTLQLSDANGSFASGFKNLGSIIDSVPGTFTINAAIPAVTSSPHYRFRMIAAVPYTEGADNGSDIKVGAMTSPIHLELSGPGQINKSIRFEAVPAGSDASQDTLYWDFGADANPPSASGTPRTNDRTNDPETIYSTGGDKTVTITAIMPGGCPSRLIFTTHIFDCTIPPIPNYAIVISRDTTFPDQGKVLWVNPGVNINITGVEDTIYGEAGSNIDGSMVCYLKTGASLTTDYGAVIYAPGASVSNGNPVSLQCPSVDFDYTNAPPNKAFPQAGVKEPEISASLAVSPNPTTGAITIEGAPLNNNLKVSIMNILGEKVLELQNVNSSSFQFDLGKLMRGTYYIRLASPNSVMTKKVVKE